MNIWEHVKLAGAVLCIIAAFMNSLLLNFVGLMIAALGVMGHVNQLEYRLKLLELKGEKDEETNS